MSKVELAARLRDQPGRLKEALELLLERRRECLQADADLASAKVRLLLTEGEIDGKNEQIRQAQLVDKTRPEAIRCDNLQVLVWAQEVEVEYQRAQLKALRSVANLLD